MGSVTEQEAREAAVKLRNALELASELNPDDHDESERDIKREFEKHETTLIRFAKQELDRRDAERAEREKPITAEWLESIGWKAQKKTGFFSVDTQDDDVSVFFDEGKLDTVQINWSSLRHIVTRGQLLALLAALKGGAT